MGTGIIVCGLNGSGKSTLGKALADKHTGAEPEPLHDDISLRRGVRSSFYGADFCPDEEPERRHTVCMSSEGDEVWAERCP